MVPDSQHLAYITRTETSANLYVYDVDSESEPDQAAAGDWLGLAAWAPDSKHLAFAQRGLDHPNGGFQRQDLFVSDVNAAEVLNRTEYFEDRQRPVPRLTRRVPAPGSPEACRTAAPSPSPGPVGGLTRAKWRSTWCRR